MRIYAYFALAASMAFLSISSGWAGSNGNNNPTSAGRSPAGSESAISARSPAATIENAATETSAEAETGVASGLYRYTLNIPVNITEGVPSAPMKVTCDIQNIDMADMFEASRARQATRQSTIGARAPYEPSAPLVSYGQKVKNFNLDARGNYKKTVRIDIDVPESKVPTQSRLATGNNNDFAHFYYCVLLYDVDEATRNTDPYGYRPGTARRLWITGQL